MFALFQFKWKIGNSCCRLQRDQRLCYQATENDKWLHFNNYSRKERVPFVVYAGLKCIFEKTVIRGHLNITGYLV